MATAEGISVTYCLASGQVEKLRPIADLKLLKVGSLRPFRIPPAYKNQRHLPGQYWVAQLGRLIRCESRLEMTVLKRIDFERRVQAIVPQPCVLHFTDQGKARSHIPDFLVWPQDDGPPLLLNVKPSAFVDLPRNRQCFDVCSAVCEQVGWDYSTQTEPPAVFLANLNWLAGYRRQPLAHVQYAPDFLRSVEAGPRTIDSLVASVGPPALVRPVLFHLLWTARLYVDMSELLSDRSQIYSLPPRQDRTT